MKLVTKTLSRLGYLKKGYTDGEIGVEWIKQFDKATREKAAGHRQLLIVDGHNSHYRQGFLEYAREHKIHVLCYPSHSTHLYQGLDVVIFSVLKRCWSDARDSYEWEHGQTVSKSNFLSVYAQAHMKALSKENILAAFWKTGVVPFNADVITAQMLAPSATSLTRGDLLLPIESPVRVINDMIHHCLAQQSDDYVMMGQTSESEDEDTLPGSTSQMTLIWAAVNDLRTTSASFLVSPSPPESTMTIPWFRPNTISPFRSHYADLLSRKPKTELEQELRRALMESEAQDKWRKHQMVGMQANTVLQAMYTLKLQAHLQGQEEDKRAKQKRRKKFVGDGMLWLCNADDFYNHIVEVKQEMESEAQEKEEQRTICEQHAEALVAWKKDEEERKACNEKQRQLHQAAVKDWEAERDQAKAEKRRPCWTKPKLTGIEGPIQWPKKVADEGEGDNESHNDNDNEMIDGDD